MRAPSAPRFRWPLSRQVRAVTGLLVLGVATGCAWTSAGAPPAAELLVAAGDSSLWIRTGDDGVQVRRAPLVLASVDDRLVELYVTETAHSYPDAVFAVQTVWRRDLVTNDSVALYVDSVVPRLAAEWAAANPAARPLDADEAESEDPAVSAIVELELLDVRGRFLTLESFSDLHQADGSEVHRTRRMVVDLRSGQEVTLAALVHDSVRTRVIADAHLAFRTARDSVLHRVGAGASRGRAAAALDRFTFDERSFSLLRTSGGPAIAFYVPNEGADVEVEALPLAPIMIPAGEWWGDATLGLPEGDDAGEGEMLRVTRWSGPRGLSLLARLGDDGEWAALALRDRRGREWALGVVAAPARRAYWLDELRLSGEGRAALERAFYEASFYGGEFRAASHRARRTTTSLMRLAAVRSAHRSSPTHRQLR